MFSKLKSVKSYGTKEVISFDEYTNLVKNNPKKYLIEQLRSIQYGSEEYKKFKTRLEVITPHGTFNGLRNDSVVSLSGYLYYDIDGISNVDDTILLLNDTLSPSFICRSSGGKGISLLFKVDDDTKRGLNDTNFMLLYRYVSKILINLGFDIDVRANGLVRKLIISSDSECIINKESILNIDKQDFNNFKNDQISLNKVKIVKKNSGSKESYYITPNDTFFKIIPFKELCTRIKFKTQYDKDIDGDFVIEDMESYCLFLPRVIKDGDKHKIYSRIVNALYFINNKIEISEVYSYLYHVNNTIAQPKMSVDRLKTLTLFLCDSIETNGVRIKPRIKRLHFNEKTKLTKNQKQSMGAQLASKIKINKTLQRIEEARMFCIKNNLVPTQNKIVEITGLSIATVKRNWNKEYQDVNTLFIKESKEKEVNIKEVIDEETFFNDDLKDLNKEDKETIIEDIKPLNNEDFNWNEWQPKRTPRLEKEEEEDYGDGREIPGFLETYDI